MPELYDTIDVAERLGVSPGRVRQLIAQGRLVPTRRVRSLVLFDDEAIAEAAFSRRNKRQDEPKPSPETEPETEPKPPCGHAKAVYYIIPDEEDEDAGIGSWDCPTCAAEATATIDSFDDPNDFI